MDAEIIDFGDEQARHGVLFGREDVLARLRNWLVGDRALARGWVLVLGGPGVGKSAILTHLLRELGEVTPHHFIRRGNEGWDRPEVIAQNLAAQIERSYPQRARPELPPLARLGDLLRRVSQGELVPHNHRLILVIDGLDETAHDGVARHHLASFLPRMMPLGVVVLCASRPTRPAPWQDDLGDVRTIDLDDGAWAESNEAACRRFWEHHALELSPPLDAAFVEEAVRCAGGNLLHAIRLHAWLVDQPAERRVAAGIPEGLEGFLTRIWSGIFELPPEQRTRVLDGLCLSCAAREPLPGYLFGELLDDTPAGGEEFLRATRPFLRGEPAPWHEGKRAYRPYHESFRAFIITKLGPPALRRKHAHIAATLAAWPPDASDPAQRRYALRHAVVHRIEAGDLEGAERLCTNVGYIGAKCRDVGAGALVHDLEATIRVVEGDACFELAAILAAVSAEGHRLELHPEAAGALLYNRLRCAGWPAERIERVLRFEGGLPALRLRHGLRLGPALLRALAGHDKPVVACAVTPDGAHALSASVDRTLRLWTLSTGECAAILGRHGDEVTACAVSGDGALALSTSADSTAMLWDLGGRRWVATLENRSRWATACCFSADGRTAIVGSDDGLLALWDTSSRRRVALLEGHTDYVTACLPMDDGRVVTASRDRTVRVWDLPARACLSTFVPAEERLAREKDERAWITALSRSPRDGEVIVACGDGSLSRWDLDSGRCLHRFGEGQGRVDTCASTPDGHVFCGLADGALSVWDLGTAERVLSLPSHKGAVSACAVTPDGRRVLTASSDRLLKLWDTGGPHGLTAREGHAAPVTACVIAPGGQVVVSASEDRTLKIWDVETGACRATLAGHDDLVTSCAVSEDGLQVLSGARDGSVLAWGSDGQATPAGDRHWQRVVGCAFLPGRQILTATHDGALWTRLAGSSGPARELGLHGDLVDGLALTPDRTRALSVSQGGTAKLWNLAARRCERTLHALSGRPHACALTPDGRRAVIALADGRVEVRDLHGQRGSRFIAGHQGRVFGCAVTPDGRCAITVAEDCTLRVSCLDTGQCLGVLHGSSWFRCVAVAPELIAAGDQEGNLWMITHASPPAPSPRLRPEDRIQLRDALARHFPESASARLLARDAGIDERRVAWQARSIETWHSLLDEAEKQDRLARLFAVVISQCAGDPELRRLAVVLGLSAANGHMEVIAHG